MKDRVLPTDRYGTKTSNTLVHVRCGLWLKTDQNAIVPDTEVCAESRAERDQDLTCWLMSEFEEK